FKNEPSTMERPRGPEMTVGRGPMPSLRFRRNGTFTIVQLTDVHWSNGEGADHRTRALIHEVLKAERADLVALTGDIVSGAAAHDFLDSGSYDDLGIRPYGWIAHDQIAWYRRVSALL